MKDNLIASIVLSSCLAVAAQAQEDAFLYLEEVDGKKALDFVEQHNKRSTEKLMAVPDYQDIYNNALEQYNSDDRIVYPAIRGNHVYNFWQDKINPRGIWRRATKKSYYSGKPAWETMIDLDALSKKDSVKWVFKGSSGLYPAYDRFIIRLSKGGGDAVICREYDAVNRRFVDNGFYLQEAKGGASYLDENTLIVQTDFGKSTLTSSGYPRQVKLWKRGTLLSDAKLIFEGKETDVSCGGYVLRDGDKKYLAIYQSPVFFRSVNYIWHNEKLVQLHLPEDCSISDLLNDQLVIELRSDWEAGGKKFDAGALVSVDFSELLEGRHKTQLVVQPDEFSSLNGTSATKNNLLVNMLNNVNSELYIFTFADGNWKKSKVEAPGFGAIQLIATDEFSDDYFFAYTNFLTPTTLYKADASSNTFKSHAAMKSYFDASSYRVEQHKVKSKDGTLVPYFVVSRKNIVYNGENPTLLYAYGGFEVPLYPHYLGWVTGKAWLEKGGVYVLANIRGGGEFGPKWHQAGLKEKRQNVYDDFHSVAEDLAKRKIADNRHLGIMGGSNGGLLVGVALTQRPDLYNAAVCSVPLLDMKRYNKLLAGASWMAEYGDPDKPEEWAYISKYSPYHNLKPGNKYPEVFFTTSTRDDRVHPGHARKMVAKMTDMGYPVYYFENTEGGHAGASTNEQRARSWALQYAYLLMKLRDEPNNAPQNVKD